MINWNNLPSFERIRVWKSLRQHLNDINDKDEIIQQIAEFFATMPYETRTLDYYQVHTWPDPWEILYHGRFCRSAISLLMYYTLDLHSIPVELVLIDDTHDRFIVPVVNNHYLNLELGVAVPVNTARDIVVIDAIDKQQVKQVI